ncbi:MAG: WecB/TagA/CpsF family glycosyltransferase [Acidobacteriaceae bacterium]|nr:WecB/TagA/CpsF family glycosyltransferase [Acidobacteriaceae bacterium]
MQELAPDSVSVLGMKVSVFQSYDAAVAFVNERIRRGKKTFCVAMNPEKVYKATRNPQLQTVLSSADMRICDGIGISLASMLLHRQYIPRCTGIDLFLKLVRLCAEQNLKIFVLGASPEVNQAGCISLLKSYPGLQIAGQHHGYFEDSQPIIESIRQSGADLLFVAMGSPRQEFWIAEHLPELSVSFCMGIGGSLDVVSGSAKRAPAAFRALGAEWLYRLLSQPGRLRRQAALPVFAYDVLKSLWQARPIS